MLTLIARAPIALAGTDDPAIHALINLTPDYSAGSRLHALVVNRLMAALPGHYSQLIGTGPAFRTIFFPGYQPDPLQPLLAECGLAEEWWAGFATAVLCQAIAALGSHIRGQMLEDKIRTDLAAYNATLRSRCARAYASVLAASYPPLVELLAKLDPATARQQFRDTLIDNVLTRQLWYQAGLWTSPEWELFNQYAKYIALGAGDDEVGTLIDALAAAGLPIPAEVGRDRWMSYAEELREKPAVDGDDIRDAAAGPIQETKSLPNPGGGMPASLPNGNCFEFTANSQPGHIYRQSPSSCCFTGDTEVLDGEGRPVKLREIRPGDRVLTRGGVATVAFVPRPLLGGRSLHRLGRDGPVFSATHPFVNGAAPGPALLALEPRRLAWAVPTLSEDGIGTLALGRQLLCRGPGEDRTAAAVPVEAIETATGDEPYLYDLNLAPAAGVRQEFWVGRGDRFYLAAPEFPVLAQAGAAACAVVAALEGLLEADWPAGLVGLLHQFGAGVFTHALDTALGATASFGGPAPAEPIEARIARLYERLAPASAETAATVAALFDGLMATIGSWLPGVAALGWRDFRALGGEILALTLYDMGLTPETPIPADRLVQLVVTIAGPGGTERTAVWDRRGRANTRFHHYFDQLIHLDLGGPERPAWLRFAASIDEAPIPTLLGEAPVVAEAAHRFQSAVLVDAAGAMIGTLRFDTRRLSRAAAAEELGRSGLWTEATATAYANALGHAMVAPILNTLRALAG